MLNGCLGFEGKHYGCCHAPITLNNVLLCLRASILCMDCKFAFNRNAVDHMIPAADLLTSTLSAVCRAGAVNWTDGCRAHLTTSVPWNLIGKSGHRSMRTYPWCLSLQPHSRMQVAQPKRWACALRHGDRPWIAVCDHRHGIAYYNDGAE